MDDLHLLTPDGYARLCREIEHLEKVERVEISQAIGRARLQGDLSENAEYQTAKDKQGYIEANIRRLQGIKQNCQIVDPASVVQDGKVRFGRLFTVRNCRTNAELRLRIVSEYEANIKDGMLSHRSPLAAAIMGHAPGDIVTVDVGDDEAQTYQIQSLA